MRGHDATASLLRHGLRLGRPALGDQAAGKNTSATPCPASSSTQQQPHRRARPRRQPKTLYLVTSASKLTSAYAGHQHPAVLLLECRSPPSSERQRVPYTYVDALDQHCMASRLRCLDAHGILARTRRQAAATTPREPATTPSPSRHATTSSSHLDVPDPDPRSSRTSLRPHEGHPATTTSARQAPAQVPGEQHLLPRLRLPDLLEWPWRSTPGGA